MTQLKNRQLIEDQARTLAEPLLAAEGLELIEVEYVREQGGFILRLYIDTPENKVGIEECTKASHAVDTALDVADFIPTGYSLEVSSPGLNRPLRKPTHFERVLGKKVRLKTFGPLGEPPRKNFLGTLTQVAHDGVELNVEGAGSFHVPFKDIAQANLEFELDEALAGSKRHKGDKSSTRP